MTPNQTTVMQYMEAFGRSSEAEVLACLTDDVEWVLPGLVHHHGQQAFAKEMHNEAFIGSPVIVVTRLVESGDTVVAEGTASGLNRDGSPFQVAFCDIFEMRETKIRKLISYLMPMPQ